MLLFSHISLRGQEIQTELVVISFDRKVSFMDVYGAGDSHKFASKSAAVALRRYEDLGRNPCLEGGLTILFSGQRA